MGRVVPLVAGKIPGNLPRRNVYRREQPSLGLAGTKQKFCAFIHQTKEEEKYASFGVAEIAGLVFVYVDGIARARGVLGAAAVVSNGAAANASPL